MNKLYTIGTIDRLLGPAIRYGTVYETITSAKKALSQAVAKSRKEAKIRGYGMVYSHWGSDKRFCRLTHGKDERSSLWETLAIEICKPGVPYLERKK